MSPAAWRSAAALALVMLAVVILVVTGLRACDDSTPPARYPTPSPGPSAVP
jgi:hypothetical protein